MLIRCDVYISNLGKGINQACKNNLIKDFSEQEFIPAFVEGKAIDSFYEEEIFNHHLPW